MLIQRLRLKKRQVKRVHFAEDLQHRRRLPQVSDFRFFFHKMTADRKDLEEVCTLVTFPCKGNLFAADVVCRLPWL